MRLPIVPVVVVTDDNNEVVKVFTLKRKHDAICIKTFINRKKENLVLYRVFFLTGPPLKMSLDWPPPNLLGLAPPLISLSVGITFTSPDT